METNFKNSNKKVCKNPIPHEFPEFGPNRFLQNLPVKLLFQKSYFLLLKRFGTVKITVRFEFVKYLRKFRKKFVTWALFFKTFIFNSIFFFVVVVVFQFFQNGNCNRYCHCTSSCIGNLNFYSPNLKFSKKCPYFLFFIVGPCCS